MLRADDSVNLSPFGLRVYLLMEARANACTHRILSLKGKIKCSSCSYDVPACLLTIASDRIRLCETPNMKTEYAAIVIESSEGIKIIDPNAKRLG